MPKVSEMTRPYFSHDEDARGDDKILKLFFSFRKLAKEMTREELESFVPIGAYGIFWSVLEYMHRNEFKTEDVEILSDDLRISDNFIKMILEDFDLFQKDNDFYYSKRLIENIEKVAEKSKARSDAVNRRWALSALKKIYKEIFDETPVLNSEEIDTFIDYYNSIEDFKTKLPDILYTLKGLKFDNNPKFNPSINWLLSENHMGKLINGEFGKLKSWQAHLDFIKEREQQRKGLEVDEQPMQEQEFDSKIDAMNYILEKNPLLTFFTPPIKRLMNKFDITVEELREESKKNG